jgi:hypothetical protein
MNRRAPEMSEGSNLRRGVKIRGIGVVAVVSCKEVRSPVRESGELFERVSARAQQQTKLRPQQQQTLSQCQIKTIPRLLKKNLSTHNQKPEVKREEDGAQAAGRRR